MAELVCLPTDPQWLDERQKGVTATDIVAVIGLSPYESPYSLYWRKRGVLLPQPDSDRLRLGRVLEAYVADRARESLKWEAEQPAGLYRSTVHPWQLATPDRVIEIADQMVPLECKTWADGDARSWDGGPPLRVRAQLLWQMDVLGATRGYAAVLFLPSGRFDWYPVRHEPVDAKACDVCEDQRRMRTSGEAFWTQLLRQEPPSPDASAASLAALKAVYFDTTPDKMAEVDFDTWADYANVTGALAHLARKKEQLQAAIRARIGDAELITVEDKVVGKRQKYTIREHTRKATVVDRIVVLKDTETEELS